MVKKIVSRAEFARRAGVSAAAVTKACNHILKDAVDGKRIDAAHPSAVSYLIMKLRDQTPPPASGLDAIYEEAVEHCRTADRYSVSGLQRHFKIGYNRAHRIITTMRANGLIPGGRDPTKPGGLKNPKPVVIQAVGKLQPHVRGTAAAKEARKRQADPGDEIPEIPGDIQAFADMTLRELIEKFGTDTRFVDWLSATQKIEVINEKRLKNAEKAGELISREVVSHGLISTIDGAFTRILTDGAKTIAVRAHALVTSGAGVAEVEDLVCRQLTTFIRPTKSKIKRVLNNA